MLYAKFMASATVPAPKKIEMTRLFRIPRSLETSVALIITRVFFSLLPAMKTILALNHFAVHPVMDVYSFGP